MPQPPIPLPPPGFILDKESSAPPPPPGFVLEGSAPPPLSEPKSLGGFAQNAVKSAGNFVGGIANAALHPIDTASNLGDVAYGGVIKGMKAVGIPGELNEEEKQQVGKFDSLVDNYRNRYGSPGKAVNTLYEDPVGVAADVSMVAGGAGAALEAGGMTRLARAANAASQATNPLVGPARLAGKATGAAVKKGFEAAGWTPERMYQSALKPSTALPREDVAALVNAGLKEEIPVSAKGLEKTRTNIDQINTDIADTINKGAQQGKAVQPTKVAGYTSRSVDKFKDQVNPTADLGSIGGSTKEFLETQGKVTPANPQGIPIPVDKAQKLKQGTYSKLRDSYGEIGTAAKEAQKDLARGLKEEIYAQFPELRDKGLREKALIDLETTLERFANRHGNKDLVGIGSTIAGSAAHAATGSNPIAAIGMLAKSALDNPGIKSKIAIALKASKRAARQPARIRQGVNVVERVNDESQYQQ